MATTKVATPTPTTKLTAKEMRDQLAALHPKAPSTEESWLDGFTTAAGKVAQRVARSGDNFMVGYRHERATYNGDL